MSKRPTIPAAPTRNGHLPPDNNAPLVGLALVLCPPLGLVAFHHCRCVKHCWQAGDREAACRASRAAHRWGVYALLVPALLFVLFMLYWGGVSARQKYEAQTGHVLFTDETEEEEVEQPGDE